MSDLDAATPRVFLARHGETEWTKNGRYTGKTDLDLTPAGVTQVTASGIQLVGPGKLIDPASVARIWVSPRERAQHTFRLLFRDGVRDSGIAEKVLLTEDIAEWDYGDYEGLSTNEIRARRKGKGLDREREWNIWRDGCEGGESAQQITERLDRLITQIHDIQARYMSGEKPADVVLVAHGHILRCFVKRWLKYPLDDPLPMMLSPAIRTTMWKNQYYVLEWRCRLKTKCGSETLDESALAIVPQTPREKKNSASLAGPDSQESSNF